MIYDIVLNLEKSGIKPRVKVSQYDKTLPQIRASLFCNNQAFNIPSGSTVFIMGTKKDNTGFEYECTYENNVITATITDQMTVFAGDVECEFTINTSDSRKGTENFILEVEPCALSDDVQISETDIPIIQHITDYIAEANEYAELSHNWANYGDNSAEPTEDNNSKHWSDVSEDYSELSHQWATYGSSSETPSATNNAKYWSGVAQQYAQGGLHYSGSVTFANIPTSGMNVGDMYNIEDDFTTDSRFQEGSGISVKAGSNIAWNPNDKWDVLALGGGGGTSDYTDLTNKPQINGVTLSGNKTSADLGLQSATIINVKDYGAKGDGVTDDSTAIQSALNVGGIIFFPDGDYVIETTLVPTDYSTLLGNNRQTARLKAKGCDAINLSNHNMVSIMNLCISPHADNVGQYTAIDLNGCNRPSIKNVLIGKFNYGIYSHTGTNWDIYCEDVYFSEPNVGLYQPDLTTQCHVIMHKCYFYGGTTTRCIDLHSTRGEFYDCRFGCQNSRAVNISDLSKLLFIGCDFEADNVITMGTEPNNTMVHIGEGFYNFINCTFVGNDYFAAGYLMQLWYTNACQFNDCVWQGVAHQYKFNIAYMGDNTLGNVYFNGLSFNPLYNYLKTNNSSIIKHIRNRYCTSQEYATRPNTANIEPYSIYHNINSGFLEYHDGTNWEILDHHTWTS